jgi:hypothetical protein
VYREKSCPSDQLIKHAPEEGRPYSSLPELTSMKEVGATHMDATKQSSADTEADLVTYAEIVELCELMQELAIGVQTAWGSIPYSEYVNGDHR